MSVTQDPIVIVSAVRTPMGAFQGDFASLAAHDLGGVAIKAAVERAGIDPAVVGEVLFGNCLMAGQGQIRFWAVLAMTRSCLMAPTPLTLAETASVFGEMLTFRRLLDQAKTKAEDLVGG